MAKYMQCFLKISRQSVQAFKSYRPETQNCSNTQQNANFPRKWHLAAILDFGKCRKTIAHNGKVLAMIPENFKAIGQGVQKFSSGNQNGGGGGKKKKKKKHIGIPIKIGMPN